MIKASQFLEQCKSNGYQFFSGTPCSYLKPLINAVIDDPELDYMDATNEGDAVGIVSGSYFSGKKGVVMFQNSGLGNAVNALTSLCFPFKIPMLVIVTHRGEPGGKLDEPQHELMGQITGELLDTLRIPWEQFPEKEEEIQACLERAQAYMDKEHLPYGLIMRDGSVEAQELQTKKTDTPIGDRKFSFSESLQKPYSGRSTRTDVLKKVLKYRQDSDLIIATTGKTGRELYTLDDSANHLYMVGSMGSASSFSLGMAYQLPERRIITLDGDAAALMRMGNLASVGVKHPSNYLQIILDNETNDSTGGQFTVSNGVSFGAIAQACGYEKVYSTDDIEELDQILKDNDKLAGPVLVHFLMKSGSPKDLGRPKVKPFEVKLRMMEFIRS